MWPYSYTEFTVVTTTYGTWRPWNISMLYSMEYTRIITPVKEQTSYRSWTLQLGLPLSTYGLQQGLSITAADTWRMEMEGCPEHYRCERPATGLPYFPVRNFVGNSALAMASTEINVIFLWNLSTDSLRTPSLRNRRWWNFHCCPPPLAPTS